LWHLNRLAFEIGELYLRSPEAITREEFLLLYRQGGRGARDLHAWIDAATLCLSDAEREELHWLQTIRAKQETAAVEKGTTMLRDALGQNELEQEGNGDA
jgi:hypothetical protein